MIELPIDEILAQPPVDAATGVEIGRSRGGRPIRGFRFGEGATRVTLIGGCHADEPVGPQTLRRLVGHLGDAPADDPLLTHVSWWVVPHVHPDGEERNRAWWRRQVPVVDSRGAADVACDLKAYLEGVERDVPGDDIEFGFPRDDSDRGARPENLAVAGFLREAGPVDLHGSFHGMDFAPGPWFLIERSWSERTVGVRDRLRSAVRDAGYAPYDVDRRGEKGFWRIDEGFTSRPDSRAMRRHFEARGDRETARLFRPSSMEHVRSLGGDPLTFVSEMPLFLRPSDGDPRLAGLPSHLAGTDGRLRLQGWLREMAANLSAEEMLGRAARRGIRPMPIRDQARLQLEFLSQCLGLVATRSSRLT